MNIHTSGKHLLGLINDLFDLSKVEAGRMELHYEPFSLLKALEESLAMIKPLAAKKGIDLGLRLEEGLSSSLAER